MPQFFFKMQRNVAFWIALLLILWVPVAWLIAEKAFVTVSAETCTISQVFPTPSSKRFEFGRY